MDAPDERDIKLQRLAGDHLADLEKELPLALWKRLPESQLEESIRETTPRSTIRTRTTERILLKIDAFQEWPQLLDPHLSKLLGVVMGALSSHTLLYVQSKTDDEAAKSRSGSMSLNRGISKILYSFCKVRGAKVVSRFFDHEPHFLEPVTTTLERLESLESRQAGMRASWEERYVFLLWLSQLALTPFDVSSFTSKEAVSQLDARFLSLSFPQKIPGIALRLLRLSFEYMVSPSKERDSAVLLLVRLSLRPDMLKLDLMTVLNRGILSYFEREEAATPSTYELVGLLSFLSSLLSSADLATLGSFHSSTFTLAQRLMLGEDPFSVHVRSSASTRKLLIKICRTSIVLSLRAEAEGRVSMDQETSEMLESAIDIFLSFLADHDTPVRYASSKALSVVASDLDSEMATEVVRAIIESFDEDILWTEKTSKKAVSWTEFDREDAALFERDVSAVSPLRWHGLTLTLSHMLFRRCSSPDQLSHVINSLLLALHFEQRTATQMSTGANIRDAACFGVWSLVRKYSTNELMLVNTQEVAASPAGKSRRVSALQLLAMELVATATLDPVGNIRRGASAALQELVGRHPDTVAQGIPVVQVVDYHAVALRSNALRSVAVQAASLDETYQAAIMEALVSWRGLAAADTISRELASDTIGSLIRGSTEKSYGSLSAQLLQHLRELKSIKTLHDIEERSGAILALSASLEAFSETSNELASQTSWKLSTDHFKDMAFEVVSALNDVYAQSPEVSRPSGTEAVFRLIRATLKAVPKTEAAQGRDMTLKGANKGLIDCCLRLFIYGLSHHDETHIDSASETARALFPVLEPDKQDQYVSEWSERIRSSTRYGLIELAILGAVFEPLNQDLVVRRGKCGQEVGTRITEELCETIEVHDRIELRLAALKALTSGVIPSGVMTSRIRDTIATCLDDYTIDSRGDVGSWLRLAAGDSVKAVFNAHFEYGQLEHLDIPEILLSRVVRLSAEKIDKVRHNAWACLQMTDSSLLQSAATKRTQGSSLSHLSQASSISYFQAVLRYFIVGKHWVRNPLLEGYANSAGGGSESVLRASRSAFILFIRDSESEIRSLSHSFCTIILEILEKSLANDRKLVPLLEFIAFLGDSGVFIEARSQGAFRWRSLLSLVQKSHFKSGNIGKIESAIKVYGGLAGIDEIRQDCIAKLVSLLGHPYPTVRNAAADTLYVASGRISDTVTRLADTDWSNPPKILRPVIEGIKTSALIV